MNKLKQIQLTLIQCIGEFMSAPAAKRPQVVAAYDMQFKSLGVDPERFYDHLLRQQTGQPLQSCIENYLTVTQR